MRKDGECTFGVLEARFRVLTSRIYRRKAEDVEKMFKVCCCLHNMIMRARDVRARMAGVNLSDTLNKCSLDDGEDLRDTNARGDIVRNLRRARQLATTTTTTTTYSCSSPPLSNYRCVSQHTHERVHTEIVSRRPQLPLVMIWCVNFPRT